MFLETFTPQIQSVFKSTVQIGQEFGCPFYDVSG
jgi:hypothetical protein